MKLILMIVVAILLIDVSFSKRRCVKITSSGYRYKQNRNKCVFRTVTKCTKRFFFKTREQCMSYNSQSNRCEQSNPCLHGGVCMTMSRSYHCNCYGTGYHGRHCQKECPLPDPQKSNFWRYPRECVQV